MKPSPSNPAQERAYAFTVSEADAGCRLDTIVAQKVSCLSRSRAASLITAGSVTVDGCAKKPGYRARPGDSVAVVVPAPRALTGLPAEPIPLDVLYEDEGLIAVNKPAGLVVHPAPGHFSGTLVNALLYRCPDLAGIGGELRPGIVHRLDKDTSGVVVAAKTAAFHEQLAAQFKARTVEKTYLALARGRFGEERGRIELPVGRHPTDRKKMSTRSRRGRPADTRWHVLERFAAAALLEVVIGTGRTHQIRVHLAAAGRPVVGDPVYGRRKRRETKQPPAEGLLLCARRQMLHAWRLGIVHPATGERLVFEAPLPKDFEGLLEALRKTEESF